MDMVSKTAGIDKAPTGIEGFDEVTGGGLPRGRTSLVMGAPGTGKTVFALQSLVNGARQWDEPAIFVAFEEHSRQIIANAQSFGWDLPALERDKLFFLDSRLPPEVTQSGPFDIAGLLAQLDVVAQDMGAKRIVFDAIDVLLSQLDNPKHEFTELARIHMWLQGNGLTGIVTLGLAMGDARAMQVQRYLTYMADCVVCLEQRVADRVALRTLRVIKYRGTSFAENEFPLVIAPEGIEVATFGITSPDLDYPVSEERVSTGIKALDAMVTGGYYRGTSVLITGAPGTAKSTLSGAFALAALQRGERALMVSFDEGGQEMMRNLSSVSIDLRPYYESGELRIYSARSQARSAEEHLIRLRDLIDEHQPQAVAIDPLSAMLSAGGDMPAIAVAQRLLHLTKRAGITVVATSLLVGDDLKSEQTAIGISTVADTWIHLSYVPQGGERNRALTIVKSRGTGHSNQVRELILNDEGVALEDVYTAGGAVLMGTLRVEHERDLEREAEHMRLEYERRRVEVEATVVETSARITAMQRELAASRAQLQALAEEQRRLEATGTQNRTRIRRLRGGDQHHEEDRTAADPPGPASDPRVPGEGGG